MTIEETSLENYSYGKGRLYNKLLGTMEKVVISTNTLCLSCCTIEPRPSLSSQLYKDVSRRRSNRVH